MINETGTFVILTPGFPSSEEDTTCLPMQQHFVNTLKALHPSMNIVVLSFQYPYRSAAYEWKDNVVFSFNGQNKGGLSRLLLRRKVSTVLKELHKRSPIVGLLSFWYGECAVVGKDFADRYRVPHFCWILGQDAGKENRYPKKLNASAGTLVALSDFLLEEFEKNHGVRPSSVITPGIDTIADASRNRDIDLIGVGSLIPLKRFELFLELVADIRQRRPGIRTVLIGDGPVKTKLIAMVRQMGLEENIELKGELAHPDVLNWMKKSKILVHPSSYEGFSGVCQEALSTGAHVVSFCRAMKQEIDHWHIVGSMDEMKSKTLELLENSGLDHTPVSIGGMKESVVKMMRLYQQ